MALADIFFKKGNYIGDIQVDVVIRESSSLSSKITSNPVENGADVNDHIIINPVKLTMEGLISNTPLGVLTQAAASVLQVIDNQTLAQSAWEDLLDLQISRTPFTLVQGIRSYDNIVIESLSTSQDKNTSNALFFTATMTEIILVGTGAPPNTEFIDEDISDRMVPSTNSGLKQVI